MTTLLLLIACLAAKPAACPPPPGQGWKPCVYSVYAPKFEGRTTASGTRFTHRGMTVACRGGKMGDRITLTYFGKTRWHSVTVTKTDTGTLPLTRPGRRQYDVTKQVAIDLGLYRKGGSREGYWRVAPAKKGGSK